MHCKIRKNIQSLSTSFKERNGDCQYFQLPNAIREAGVLNARKYTIGTMKEFMEESGVFEKENCSDELVVEDGNIITARGRGFIRFGCCLGKALNLEFNERWYRE